MLNYSTYLLLASFLLNNCSAIYVVNSKDLFELSSIRKVLPKDRIKTRITSIPIYFRRRRVFRNLMNRLKSKGTKDLILEDVTLIEGFYTNIVSEAQL
jgi:hypothetical protein